MNKLDKAKVDKLIHTLGLKYNLTDKEIKEITSSPYQFTQKTIKKLDFSEIKEEEEFNSLKTNFIYKCLGTLYPTFNLIRRQLTQKNIFKEINNKRWKKY
tara:strand:- start:87389 stop:87688 length:300 start_codon:yes stop_codon:yes gene_type:complete